MTVFFTSDTHFGDPRVLRVDRRPFKTIPAHDEALIERWNAAVSADDEVWHLGDFALATEVAQVEELLSRLQGRKNLVSGNNDGPATLSARGWASVQAYAEIEENGRNLVLCHYPFRTWHNMNRGWVDLHGHSHGRLSHKTRQYDVGVDVWDYRPVTLSMILNSRLHRWKTAS